MTWGLLILILEAILKIPDIIADIKAFIEFIRNLNKIERMRAVADFAAILKRHVNNPSLTGADLAHDIAVLQVSLDQ